VLAGGTGCSLIHFCKDAVIGGRLLTRFAQDCTERLSTDRSVDSISPAPDGVLVKNEDVFVHESCSNIDEVSSSDTRRAVVLRLRRELLGLLAWRQAVMAIRASAAVPAGPHLLSTQAARI